MRRFFPFLFAVFLCSCSADKSEHSAPIMVHVMSIDSISDYTATCYIGSVEPLRQASLFSLHSGHISAVAVHEGDYVAEGALVAEIESQNVRSALSASEASLRQAEDGLHRAEQVYSTHSIPEVQMVEIRTKVEQARAAAAASRQAMAECRITAPFAGVVSHLDANIGVEVSPATPVATIMDVSELRLSISVPERDINKISVGDTAVVSIPSLNRRCKAVLTTKGLVSSPLSHTYACLLRPLSIGKDVMPGMMCKVYPVSGGSHNLIVIPAEVVRMDSRGKYVWCVSSDSSVTKRYVSLGDFVGRGVVVSAGLTFSDMVITAGTQKVSSGMHVVYETE